MGRVVLLFFVRFVCSVTQRRKRKLGSLHAGTGKIRNEMNTMKIYALFLVSPFLVSCAQKEEVHYYPTGEVEYRAPLSAKGVFDKEVVYFYKNGKNQAVVPFANGHVNGIIRRFYPTGVLESTEFRKDGKLAGEMKQYYPNARIKYEAKKVGERFVDTARYYHPNGEVAQLIVYDSSGRKIDFGVWNRAGKLDPTYTRPLFLSGGDTIAQGENYCFEVRLGNRRSNAVIIRPVVPAGQLDSTKGKYAPVRFVIRQPTLGAHVLRVNIYENWARKGSDTIWTNDYQVKHVYSVRR